MWRNFTGWATHYRDNTLLHTFNDYNLLNIRSLIVIYCSGDWRMERLDCFRVVHRFMWRRNGNQNEIVQQSSNVVWRRRL